MFKKLHFFIIFFVAALFTSCHKDLGNYEYQAINEINFEGIENDYTAFLGEHFEIKPVLKFTQDQSSDSSKYSYEWIGIRQDGALPDDQKKAIAQTRNLDLIMTLPPAPYKVYYRVTDKNTGVQWQKTFNLTVVTSIYQGWLLMNDVNGKARLDMVSFVDSATTKTFIDVLGTVGSKLPPLGKPKFVYTYSFQRNTYGIYVSTETGTNRIHPETFDWEPTYNIKYEMAGGNVPDGFSADLITSPDGETSYMLANDNVYYYFRTFQIFYSVPINVLSGETQPFKPAPFIAANEETAAILYDQNNRRFLRHVGNKTTVTAMPTGTLFDYNTGKDLVYMTFSQFGGQEVFSILKDPADGKYYLARFTFRSYSNNIVQTYYDEMTATDIENAEQFAVSPDLGYIFYNVGGKLYEYDMSAKTSKLMLDKGTEKISLIKFNENYESSKLMVCSYDPATAAVGTGGKMEFYIIPPVQGDLVLDKSYSGFGKIVSVAYRPR